MITINRRSEAVVCYSTLERMADPSAERRAAHACRSMQNGDTTKDADAWRRILVRSELRILVVLTLISVMVQPSLGKEISAEALRTVTRSTVLIESTYVPHRPVDDSDMFPSWGTGFVVAEEGLIITNAHVVDAYKVVDMDTGKSATPETNPARRKVYRLDRVTVRFDSGESHSRVYPAQVLCTHEDPIDLALMRVTTGKPLPAIPLASNEQFNQLAALDEVWAVGFPLGQGLEWTLTAAKLKANPNGADISVRNGRLTALRRDGQRIKVLEHNCNIEHGNSGGPLVDDQGRIIGINYLGIGERSYFAIPVPVLLSTFSRTLKDRAGLGGRTKQPKVFKVATDDELQAARLEARSGDTIDIAAGEYRLQHDRDGTWVSWPGGAWVHGAGADKTTLIVSANNGPVATSWSSSDEFEENDYRGEISDLTILQEEANDDGSGSSLTMIVQGSPEVFVHDITIRSRIESGYCLSLSTGHVVNCRLEKDIQEPHGGFDNKDIAASLVGGTLERVQLANALIHQTGSRIRGCTFAPDERSKTVSSYPLQVAKGSHVVVEGSHFTGQTNGVNLSLGLVRINSNGGGDFNDNLFCLLLNNDLELVEPGNVSFTSNQFLYYGPRNRMGVPAFGGTKPERVYIEEIAARVISGRESDVSFKGNVFFGCWAISTPDIVADTGTVLTNGNGNQYVDEYEIRN